VFLLTFRPTASWFLHYLSFIQDYSATICWSSNKLQHHSSV